MNETRQNQRWRIKSPLEKIREAQKIDSSDNRSFVSLRDRRTIERPTANERQDA